MEYRGTQIWRAERGIWLDLYSSGRDGKTVVVLQGPAPAIVNLVLVGSSGATFGPVEPGECLALLLKCNLYRAIVIRCPAHLFYYCSHRQIIANDGSRPAYYPVREMSATSSLHRA